MLRFLNDWLGTKQLCFVLCALVFSLLTVQIRANCSIFPAPRTGQETSRSVEIHWEVLRVPIKYCDGVEGTVGKKS